MAAATGLVLSVAQTLFAALSCKELKEVCSAFGHESQLLKLQQTVTTINAVLLDVESKHQELTQEGRDWVESLKDAVYDVDDLVDEFKTIALQRKQMRHAKISKKVRRFFSRYNKLLFAFNTSQQIKKLREKLDSIAKNRSDFGLGDVYEPVKRREDTDSFVREESIIGRDTDKEAIVGVLLGQETKDVSFVSVVGIGGLGKTALAQLVFNDGRIKTAFGLRMWVCVSEDFSMEDILCKMLERDGLRKEALQREVRQKIEGKKYLLVLDDVWNEDRDDWVTLRDFLCLGGKGSVVLVTSRSKKVAKVIQCNLMYELQGLSEENSWSLFKKMAFEQREDQEDAELVQVGKDIVKKGAGVPLAIRMIGSLLFGQMKDKWLQFRSIDLSTAGQGKEKGVMPVLKFSYHQLTPSLKSCFSYCALFPEDHVFRKEELIYLWLAHGCLHGEKDGKSLEDVGEEYFSILLQRCFFQDVKKDGYGEIYSCKMHDLIYDLAKQVAGQDICLVNKSPASNKKIRHLMLRGDDINVLSGPCTGKVEELRTLFSNLEVAKIIASCRRLRVLRLEHHGMKMIPRMMIELPHLRFLDLSRCGLEMLPTSITNLINLQVMILRGCRSLKELPNELRKLVNLRHLVTSDCIELTHMPSGMHDLVNLHTLSMFVLGGRSVNQVQIGHIQDLKPLINLRGKIHLKLDSNYSYDATNVKGGYLINKSHIKALKIGGKHFYFGINDYRYSTDDKTGNYISERLLEGLEPHRHVRCIEIKEYEGVNLPRWVATMGTSFPWLVTVSLWCFCKLRHLPTLSKLENLNYLSLVDMPEVEYMEGIAASAPFFPALETLKLESFAKLKGWWMESGGQLMIPLFPRLRTLGIIDCPSITSFPIGPHLKDVCLHDLNGELTFHTGKYEANPYISNDNSGDVIYDIDDTGLLNSLLGKSLPVTDLRIREKWFTVESLSGEGIVHLTDLQVLDIIDCDNIELSEDGDDMPWKALDNLTHLSLLALPKVVSLPKGIQYLTTLQVFEINRCNNLELGEDREEVLWKGLCNLTNLHFGRLPKLVNLPKGIQCLTSLQSLDILGCENLEALPEWLDCFASLQSLSITRCFKLKLLPEAVARLPSLKTLNIRGCHLAVERCREPDGEDWPKICHIPKLQL